jgi:hypothetical protein
MDGVICAGRCWSLPEQSTTDIKTLQNSHPVLSKKRGRRSRRLFTRKEIVVLVENLYVFRGEQIGIQCLPATAFASYSVWFMSYIPRPVLLAWTRGMLHPEQDTWIFRKWVFLLLECCALELTRTQTLSARQQDTKMTHWWIFTNLRGIRSQKIWIIFSIFCFVQDSPAWDHNTKIFVFILMKHLK